MLTVTPATTVDAVDALRPDWLALFEEAGVRNPFAHPDWLISWACHFVGPHDVHVLAVRDGSQLVGVAPLCRRTVSLLGARCTALRTLGSGRYSQLTEMPQVLAAPRQSRRVLRAVVAYLCAHGDEWDWAEVDPGPGGGWFEREWIPHCGAGSGSVALHKGTRAFVVLPLAATWDELRAGLKRNVRESVRRGANRLAREAHEWRVVEPGPEPEAVDRAVTTLIELHRARAAMQGVEPHPDYFGDRREEAFLHDVASRLHASGTLTPLVLEVDGAEVAARLVLETGDGVFLSASGLDPAWWRYNVGTTLLASALRRSIDRGRRIVNLSHGPDVSKLRWSEELELAQSFVLVGARRRSRAAFTAFWHLRAEYVRREQRRRQRAGS